MPEWIDPVFDRTQADCDNHTAKGVLNASDLNRIEDDTHYLAQQLNERGYYIPLAYSAGYPWTRERYLLCDTLNAIIDALRQLREKSFDMINLPTLPSFNGNDFVGYDQINILEYYLYDTNWIIMQLDLSPMMCGEVFCGE